MKSMEPESKNLDDYAAEIAEARVQQMLLRYEYIRYKASSEAISDYENFE